MRRPTPSPSLARALLPALACIVAILPVAAPAAAETTHAGEVTERRGSRVKVAVEGSRARVGDPVIFHVTIDGFELEASSGTVAELGQGFVWVEVPDERVVVGAGARVAASVRPGDEYPVHLATYFGYLPLGDPGHPVDQLVPALRRLDTLAGPPGADAARDEKVGFAAFDVARRLEERDGTTATVLELWELGSRRGRAYTAQRLCQHHAERRLGRAALAACERAAELGEVQGALEAGQIYLLGLGVAPDPGAAQRWFDRAEELTAARSSGNPEFQVRMLRDTIDAYRRCNADPVCREKKRVGWRP